MRSNTMKMVIRGEDKSKAAFRSAGKGIATLSKKLFSLKGVMLGALGVAGLGAMAKGILDTGDKMHKLSIRLGASTEALSQLKHAASMSGVSFDTLAMGMQRMTRRVAEAANGTGEAKGALEELNLDAEELTKLSPDEQFKEIAEAMREIDSQSEKVRLAMKVFDSEGVSLIQLMQQGADGINEMMEEADELGNTLSGKDAEAIAAFNDALEKVKQILVNISRDIMLEFLPAIEDLLFDFSEWWKINKDLVAMRIGDYWQTITEKMRELWPEVKKIAEIFLKVARAIVWTTNKVDAFKGSFSGLFSLIGAFSNFRKAFEAFTSEPIGEAEALANAGGGEEIESGDPDWASGSGGTTVNINQQLSRNDVTAIMNETARREGRL